MKDCKLVGRGKLKQTAILDVAREMLVFIWSIAITAGQK